MKLDKPISGCVTLPKDLLDADLLNREPANRKSACLDLWKWANDRPRTITVNGRLVKLERGQLAYAQTTLAKFWRWSPEKVKAVLVGLQDEGLITFDSSTTTTIITLPDYTVYNPDTTPKPGPEPATDSATEPAQKKEVGRGKMEGGRENAPNLPEIPTDEAVAKFCAAHLDLSVGITKGIPATWWKGWLAARLESGKPFPMDWKRAIALRFGQDWADPTSPGYAKAHGAGVGGKNGGGAAGETTPQRRFRLDRELEGLMEQLEALGSVGADYRPLEPQIEAVKLELKELELLT
jgi:hypothetical protein